AFRVLFAVTVAVVRGEALTGWRWVWNGGLWAECGEVSVTLPAAPLKTASLLAIQATSEAPSNHLADESHDPFLPRLAPPILLPVTSPSPSQYNVDAPARRSSPASATSAARAIRMAKRFGWATALPLSRNIPQICSGRRDLGTCQEVVPDSVVLFSRIAAEGVFQRGFALAVG